MLGVVYVSLTYLMFIGFVINVFQGNSIGAKKAGGHASCVLMLNFMYGAACLVAGIVTHGDPEIVRGFFGIERWFIIASWFISIICILSIDFNCKMWLTCVYAFALGLMFGAQYYGHAAMSAAISF